MDAIKILDTLIKIYEKQEELVISYKIVKKGKSG